MPNYKEKYLKYAQKIENLQKGGGFHAFRDTGKFYIIANLGGETKVRLTERYMQAFGQHPARPFHFSLLQLDINKKSRFDPFLKDLIANSGIVDTLVNDFKVTMSNTILTSSKGDYRVAKVYIASDEQAITRFRVQFYRALTVAYNRKMNGNIQRGEKRPITDPKTKRTIDYQFFIDANTKEELYAVPEWYFGLGAWSPHLTIGYTTLIQGANAAQIDDAFRQTARPPGRLGPNDRGNAISMINARDSFESISITYMFGPPNTGSEISAKGIF